MIRRLRMLFEKILLEIPAHNHVFEQTDFLRFPTRRFTSGGARGFAIDRREMREPGEMRLYVFAVFTLYRQL